MKETLNKEVWYSPVDWQVRIVTEILFLTASHNGSSLQVGVRMLLVLSLIT